MENNTERKFPLFKILTKNLLLIILISVLCALLGLGYSILRVKPVYTASRSVIIRTTLSSDTSASALPNQAALSKIYLGTISNIIKGDEIIKTANGLLEDEEQMISAGDVGMSYDPNSLIFRLTYTDYSKEWASAKLNAFVSAVASKIGGFIQAENVYIIDTQKECDIFETNFYSRYTLIGLCAGVVISVLIVLLIYALDNTVKSKEEMEELTGASVVAFIEKDVDKPNKKAKAEIK